ncbi:MAG TPA: VCBS repeat-containing protein [Thermodesulfovibrionales bacterium]|nr:VCBS repeat-containing protein [Thermodesulfovibrionales bacterium]
MRSQDTKINKNTGEGQKQIVNSVFALLSLIGLLFLFSGVACAQDPLRELKDETLSYFTPLKGTVIAVMGKVITSDLGSAAGVRKGMRFAIHREGTPFLHPITKEPMGRIETPVGSAVVREVKEKNSVMEIIKGDASLGDVVRISEMKPRVLFFQDKSADWNLADSYYDLLKESGRFEIIDTSLNSASDDTLIAEAKKVNATLVFALTGRQQDKELFLKQRIFWVEDASALMEDELKVEAAYAKALGGSRTTVAPIASADDTLLSFDLPFGAKLVALGDLKGDGTHEIILSTGRDLRVFTLGSGLQDMSELKVSATDDFLWIETADVDGDGKDEIIVTSLRGRNVDTTSDSLVRDIKDTGRVVSYIYALKGSELSLLWKGNLFLRYLPQTGLVAQKFDVMDGFGGPVFRVTYSSGEVRAGDDLKLPKGVNIYDFVYIDGSGATRNVLAYDDSGYLNLYNEMGLRIWRSTDDYGGMLTTFQKAASTVMVDKGAWSIKDGLFVRNRDTFAVKRIPLSNMAKGLGYKSSQIKTLLWTGFSMEESTLVDGISGAVQDYGLVGDKLIVLSRPMFGIKFKNIMKGESPLGSMLYIYSLKGM